MRRFQPALLGGTFVGILSSLPIVSTANLCCCLWVITGGMLTVDLQRQNPLEPGASPTTEAVLGGLVAGLVGAVINLVLSALIFSAASPTDVQEVLNQLPQVPPELGERMVRLLTGGAFVFVIAAVTLPVYAVFGVIGALLGSTLFKPKSLPPATGPTFGQPGV